MKISSRRKGRYILKIAVLSVMAGMLVYFGPCQLAFAEPQIDLQKFWSNTYGKFIFPPDPGNNIMGYDRTLLAKAQPDECFQGVGNPLNFTDPNLGFNANYPGNLTNTQQKACHNTVVPGYPTPDNSGEAQPKTNQAYVWGLTKYGNQIWFGTIANTLCLVFSGYLGMTTPSLNDSWVCEGGLKDIRPPRAYYYDLRKNKLVEVTQKILGNGPSDAALLESTIGLRSAGSARGVIFLGGIGAGVNIFAFNAQTGAYLGSINYPQYTNIRQWRLVGNELYVGLGKNTGGEILRWTGKLSSNINQVFSFEKVGDIGGDPAYMTPHEGRLFVSSWPASAPGSAPMSIYMSPLIGQDGKLTSADANGWTVVWRFSDYEPEASVVYSAGGGAIMSFDGYLYWGTMHVPGVSLLVWESLYPSASAQDKQVAILGTYRPLSVFRGRNFGTKMQAVSLLYGNSNLPEYTPATGWQIVPNKMNQKPRYGLAGFGNFFNNYTWWMEVFQDKLFVGTMDFSYLVAVELGQQYQFPKPLIELGKQFWGADLWQFPSSYVPALPVSLNGVGNYLNYGIRTMLPTNDALYLGTANPMNLKTDPKGGTPLGGWELIKLE